MSRFATLDSLRKKDGEEGKQSFYAGGAGANGGSGVSVYGGKKPANAKQLDKIFASVQPPTEAGGEEDESKESTKITFWSNGFQVDDGPFRDSEAPENKAFLANIEKGYIPRELREAGRGRKIVVADKRSEEYKPPTPPPYTAFSGAGNTMADDDATLSNDAALGVAATGVGSAEFSVDASLPTTNVRVTMANGKRQVFKFNTTHTVADLLAQVGSASDTTGAFALMAGFPPAPLTDSGATLEAAGLLNSNVRMNLL